jgi:hypothetical protein
MASPLTKEEFEQRKRAAEGVRRSAPLESAVKLLRAEVWAKVYAAEVVRELGPVNASYAADRAAAQFDDYCRRNGL